MDHFSACSKPIRSVLQDLVQVTVYSLSTLLIEHMLRLREAGCLDLSIYRSEIDASIEWLEIHGFIEMTRYKNYCKHELKRMNKVRLDVRTTLRDALRIREPRRLQQLAINKKFKRIVDEEAAALGNKKKKKYPMYGGYNLRLQYERNCGKTTSSHFYSVKKTL